MSSVRSLRGGKHRIDNGRKRLLNYPKPFKPPQRSHYHTTKKDYDRRQLKLELEIAEDIGLDYKED